MATSGTIGETTYNLADFITHAFRRTKAPAQALTPEIIDYATKDLHLILNDLVLAGVPLWSLDKVILPMVEGQVQNPLPAGTVDVLRQGVMWRSVTRLTGTASSSAGGTAANAFDGDLDTVCTQVSANGSLTLLLASATAVTTVGFCPNGTNWYELVWEWSDDGLTWTEALASTQAQYTDRVFTWADIDGQRAHLYWRVREAGGQTIDVREVVFANNPAERVMARINEDDYVNLPNKTFTGQPLQFWLQRAIDPVMWIWPAPNAQQVFYQIVAWRLRQIEDPGLSLANTIAIPPRWYNAITWKLAAHLVYEVPEVPAQMIGMLEAKAAQAEAAAWGEESDNSPTRMAPNIAAYTS